MPLLHRKVFVPLKPSDDLDLNEEVFHCPLTNEIFRDYDQFYERTILCNSLVWSCSITDRPNLTYQEALDCENEAKQKLAEFPVALQKPILFLAGLANGKRIDELNENIYVFIKERFFPGEIVDVIAGKSKRCNYDLIRICPTSKMNGTDGRDSDDGDNDDVPLSSLAKSSPSDVQYVVKERKATASETTLPGSFIRRKAGVATRQNSKLLLKAHCYKSTLPGNDGCYVVKDETKARLGLDSLSWGDLFVGQKPAFVSAPIKPTKMRKATSGVSAAAKQKQAAAEAKLELKRLQEMERLKNEKRLELKKARDAEKEVKKREKEEERKRKAEESEKLREAIRLDKEKRRKEREEELAKMKLEREQVKQEKLEEKRRHKEWSRPRDDLECDDLKELPTPQPIYPPLPASLFGDVLSLLEFFYVFGDLYDARDEFPQGVSLDVVARALTSTDHDGPLCELFFFFLSNLFRCRIDEEEDFEQLHTENGDRHLAAQLGEMVNEDTIQASATIASTWPLTYQGLALNQLELDSYTLTEILRLYLISSAARTRAEDRAWRFQQRGGYSTTDDIPMRLCLDRPDLIAKLATISVFDLSPADKLTLLLCLAHHLHTYVTARDFVDETWEKLQQARQTFRDDKQAEKRRERDVVAERGKWKFEQLQIEKQIKMKELEERLKREEKQLPAVAEVEGDEVARALRKRKQDEDNDTPRALSQNEKEERLRAFDDDEQQAKEAWNYRYHKHQDTIAKLQACFRTAVIGQDRYYRRYWTVSWIPGILVEEFIDPTLTDEVLSVRTATHSSPQQQLVAERRNGDVSASFSQETDVDCGIPRVPAYIGSTPSDTITEQLVASPSSIKVASACTTQVTFSGPTHAEPDGVAEVASPSLTQTMSDGLTHVTSDNPVQVGSECVTQPTSSHLTQKVANCVTELIPKNPTQATSGSPTHPLSPSSTQQPPDSSTQRSSGCSTQSTPDDRVTAINSAQPESCGQTISHNATRLLTVNLTRRSAPATTHNSPKVSQTISNNASAGAASHALTLTPDMFRAMPVCKLTDIRKSCPSSPAGLLLSTSCDLQLPSSKKSQGKRDRWFVYRTEEELERLMTSLNARGHRESALLQRLHTLKDVIVKRMRQSKTTLLNINNILKAPSGDESSVVATGKPTSELARYLRDQILDLEQKIWAGNLGHIQVSSRTEWREAIASGCKFEGQLFCDITVNALTNDDDNDDSAEISDPFVAFPACVLPSHDMKCSVTRDEVDGTAMYVDEDETTGGAAEVRRLSSALLLVERGLERRYIQPPLGVATATSSRVPADKQVVPDEKRKAAERLMRRWESSLVTCQSVSQAFLHLSTLERCITWSKSVLNAKCRLCRRKGDAEKMLLCDMCDRGHHMYCLRPPLKNVPAGDWFCPNCKPKTRLTPRKVVRTKSFSQDEEESSEDEGEEDDEEKENNLEQEESSQEEDDPPTTTSPPPPARKNLTYKIPQRPQQKSKRQSTSNAKRQSNGAKREESATNHASNKDKAEVATASGERTSRRRTLGADKDLSVCRDILLDIMKHKISWPFLEPVNRKLVPDYYDIITKPMDLGTIRKKFNDLQYSVPTEFISDVDQVFTNCHVYNESRSFVAKSATQLQSAFDQLLIKFGLDRYRAPFRATLAHQPPPGKKRRTT